MPFADRPSNALVGRDRRRVARQAVDWPARYMIVGLPELGWNLCRVVDISLWGAGVILLGAAPDETFDRALVIELARNTTHRASLTLRGEVRHHQRSDEGWVRVGVELDATGFDRQVLRVLLRADDAVSSREDPAFST